MRAIVTVDPAERIAGLLEANNRYLARAREAEAKANILALALKSIGDLAGRDDARLTGLMTLGAVYEAAAADGVKLDVGANVHSRRLRAAVARAFPDRFPTRDQCVCLDWARSDCAICPSAEDLAEADRELSTWLADRPALPDSGQAIVEIAADALAGIEVTPIPRLIALVDFVEVVSCHFDDLDYRKRSTTLIAAALARIVAPPAGFMTAEEVADLEEALRSWQADQSLGAEA